METIRHAAGLVPIGLGIGSILLWLLGFVRRPPATLEGRSDVKKVMLGLTVLLVVSAWINFLMVSGSKAKHGPAPAMNVGFIAGIAVGAVAIRAGIRMEQNRLASTGAGTPRGSMAKRVALFFSALALVHVVLWMLDPSSRYLRLPAVAGLCILGIPGAIAWRLWPEAGPVATRFTIACRATFFGLAVLALVSLAGPWLVEWPPGRGGCIGVGSAVLLLLAAAWVATRYSSRTTILIVGLLGGVCGLLLMRPI